MKSTFYGFKWSEALRLKGSSGGLYGAAFAMVHRAAGVSLWGLGLGAQDSIIKALLARIMPSKRSTAFGLFDTIFGVSWFVGSTAMGLLYANSLIALVVLSTALQLAALPLLWVGDQRCISRPQTSKP